MVVCWKYQTVNMCSSISESIIVIKYRENNEQHEQILKLLINNNLIY